MKLDKALKKYNIVSRKSNSDCIYVNGVDSIKLKGKQISHPILDDLIANDWVCGKININDIESVSHHNCLGIRTSVDSAYLFTDEFDNIKLLKENDVLPNTRKIKTLVVDVNPKNSEFDIANILYYFPFIDTLYIRGNIKYLTSNNDTFQDTKDLIIRNAFHIKHIFVQSDVLQICNNAFYFFGNLVSVELPDTIELIGNAAFMGCHNLKNIRLPKNLMRIENFAFSNCEKLICDSGESNYFTIFNGMGIVKKGPWNQLVDCWTKDENLTIPKCVDDVYFFQNPNVKHIDFENENTFIGNGCFAKNCFLESINLPKNLERIGANTFAGCVNLKSVNMKGCNIKRIDTSSFDKCWKLKELDIPDSVEMIMDDVFLYTKLKSLTISKNVKDLGYFLPYRTDDKDIEDFHFIYKGTKDELIKSIDNVKDALVFYGHDKNTSLRKNRLLKFVESGRVDFVQED